MKFVKLKDIKLNQVFEGWFLSGSPDERLDIDFQVGLNRNMINKVFKDSLNDHISGDLSAAQKLRMVVENPLNYNEIMTKYGPIYIRQIGSYMLPSKDYVITNVVERDSWPTENEGGEIVICENDLVAEEPWMCYLNCNYPSKSINILNSFRNRTLTDVQKHFDSAKYITFHTTFSQLDWFELLLNS